MICQDFFEKNKKSELPIFGMEILLTLDLLLTLDC
jgi:hypothetical protein